MKVSRTRHRGERGEEQVLRVEGELDAFTAPELRTEVETLINERPTDVTLDLSELSLIDSSAVGVIVSLYRRLRERGGQLTISGLSGQPQTVFEMLKRFFQGGRSTAVSP